jgi:hypothetical protein
MSRVVVEGRALELCRVHAVTVVTAMPETFDDLRALFAGTGVDLAAHVDRRARLDRRAVLDRRVFPPRPEGRRCNDGRRADDPAG